MESVCEALGSTPGWRCRVFHGLLLLSSTEASLTAKPSIQHAMVEEVLEKELGVPGATSYLGHQLAQYPGTSHFGLHFPPL